VIFLSGALGRVLEAPRQWNMGVLATPTSTGRPQLDQIRRTGMPWAIDNEEFGGRFELARWERWLRSVPRAARLTCLFVVVPDVLIRDRQPDGSVRVRGDAAATYARFWEFTALVREIGYRQAFVSQDGATSSLVPWDEIDCLFVGGSDDWKLCDRSVSLIREAQERGLWTHMGRCQARGSVGGRIGAAHAIGMDSCDGTVLKRDPSRLGRIMAGLDDLNAHQSLWEAV
jgi:hypothetical protein